MWRVIGRQAKAEDRQGTSASEESDAEGGVGLMRAESSSSGFVQLDGRPGAESQVCPILRGPSGVLRDILYDAPVFRSRVILPRSLEP